MVKVGILPSIMEISLTKEAYFRTSSGSLIGPSSQGFHNGSEYFIVECILDPSSLRLVRFVTAEW